MASQAQIEANRKNAQKSTGPRTKAGKDISRSNAIIHGLSGRGIVILEEHQEEVAELAAFYVGMLGGQDAAPHDIALAEQVALDSVRSRQCLDQEEGLFLEDSVNAEFGWDHAQATAALDLAESLGRRPALVSHKLEETTHGCAYKIERWTWLIGHLDETPDTTWDTECRTVAFDLLGIPREFRKVCKKIETLAQQRTLANNEIERLRKKQTDWLDRLSAFRRDQTISGTIFPSKAVWRLRHYGMAATRRFFSGMNQIHKRQEVLRQLPAAVSDPEIVAASALERERTRQQTSRDVHEAEATFKAILNAPVAPVKSHTLASVATVPAPKPLAAPSPVPVPKPEPTQNDASAERKRRRADKKRQRQARKRS